MEQGFIRNYKTRRVVRTFESKNRRRTDDGRSLNSKKISNEVGLFERRHL